MSDTVKYPFHPESPGELLDWFETVCVGFQMAAYVNQEAVIETYDRIHRDACEFAASISKDEAKRPKPPDLSGPQLLDLQKLYHWAARTAEADSLDADRPLTGNEQKVLAAIQHLSKEAKPGEYFTSDQIAVEAFARGADSSSVRRACKILKAKSLVESRAGRGVGGYRLATSTCGDSSSD